MKLGRNETLKMANTVHCGTSENLEPKVVGLLNTLTTKVKKQTLISKLLGNVKVEFSIKSQVLTAHKKGYYTFQMKINRSLNVYHCHNFIGKRKYFKVRSTAKDDGLPTFVPQKISHCDKFY